jgi:hypothetical protein
VISTDTADRAAYIDGLLSLACFLEAHPDVPVPPAYGGAVKLMVFPDGATDDEQRAGVDAVAAVLGVPADEPNGSGHYCAGLAFGPVMYEACAIPRAARSRRELSAVAA